MNKIIEINSKAYGGARNTTIFLYAAETKNIASDKAQPQTHPVWEIQMA